MKVSIMSWIYTFKEKKKNTFKTFFVSDELLCNDMDVRVWCIQGMDDVNEINMSADSDCASATSWLEV